jgi:eukaryotic-like serine/threonine-protein kinase
MAGSATGGGSLEAAAATEALEGTTVAGKYLIDRLIGQGGMGAVFAGRNLLTDKRVALKWLSPDRARNADALARFRREALAAGRIDHPNVIQVYDVLEENDGSVFLVMELLHGEPLANVVVRMGGEISVSDAIALLVPAMRGIAAAHDRGVVHRDLKPENIFLCRAEDGMVASVKVLDFGVSKLHAENESLSITTTGMVVGTPYYMSPEQVRGMRDLDQRVDVYAMGVVLYELLSGQPPFDADSYSALMVDIATATPPALHTLCEVSEEVERIVERAMARDRAERYPDMESLAVALEPHGPGVTFRETRPDGTARISLQVPSGRPTESRARISSRAATALLGGTGVQPASSISQPAEAASPGSPHATSEEEVATGVRVAPQIGRRPSLPRVAWAALVLLAAGLAVAAVLWVRGGGEAAPVAPVAAPSDVAVPEEAPATTPAAPDPDPPPPSGSVEGDDPSGGTAGVEAKPAQEATAPEGDEIQAEPPAARAKRRPLRRRRGAPARTARPATEPEPAGPAKGDPQPRAGSLSLDDF